MDFSSCDVLLLPWPNSSSMSADGRTRVWGRVRPVLVVPLLASTRLTKLDVVSRFTSQITPPFA